MESYIETSMALTDFLDKLRLELKRYPINGKSVDMEIDLACLSTGHLVLSNEAHKPSVRLRLSMGMMGIDAHMSMLNQE